MRLLFFVLIFFSININSQQKINFVEIELKQALERAKIENKMVFIDAYAKWCRPCKQMDIEFKNPSVIEYFNKNFINVKVNVEKAYGLNYKRKYQIVFLPSLIFIDFNGNQKTKVDNVISGNELLSIGKFINNKYGPNGNKNVIESNNSPINDQVIHSTPFGSSPLPAYKIADSKQKKNKPSSSKSQESNPNEKILYVMGTDNDDLPPEVLKQEAYFRMQLMDGSHNQCVKDYLETQVDWLTEGNMRFIFDFMDNCRSDLFNHLIDNRVTYEELIGKDNIYNTLNIIIHKELVRAFPRPSQDDALRLYTILDKNNAEELSSSYHLENLFSIGNYNEFSEKGMLHVSKYPHSDSNLSYRIYDQTIQKTSDKKTLKYLETKLKEFATSDPNNEEYFFSLAEIYLKLKDKSKAIKNINIASKLCKSKGISNKKITNLYNLINT